MGRGRLCVMVSALVLSAGATGFDAYAQGAFNSPPGRAAPAPNAAQPQPVVQPEGEWRPDGGSHIYASPPESISGSYGWQTLATDAGAVPLAVSWGAVDSSSPALLVRSGATYALGGPVGHAAP